MNKQKALLILIILGIVGIGGFYFNQKSEPKLGAIESQFVGKNREDKRMIVIDNIVQQPLIGTFVDTDYYNGTIEVQSVNKVDNMLEIYARAFNADGVPMGFGSDGSVEWERFVFKTPEYLVEDATGPIVKSWTTPDGEKITKHQREDPLQAIKNNLASTIKVSVKNVRPTLGKYGHTTYTYNPDIGTGGNTVDGDVCDINEAATTWGTIRGNNGNAAGTADSCYSGAGIMDIRWQESAGSQFRGFQRDIFTFNATTTAGTISSATISLYGAASGNNENNNPDFGIYKPFGMANPNPPASIQGADYNIGNWQSDLLSTSTWPYSSFTVGAYMDLGLTATSGIPNINSTSTSIFGARNQQYDVAGATPANTGTGDFYIEFYQADFGSNAPKLVIVTEVVATTNFNPKRKTIIIE